MQRKSPDILWIFAALIAGGVLLSAASAGTAPATVTPLVSPAAAR
jgi:hypothetical protein